jgi:hypothetical protein
MTAVLREKTYPTFSPMPHNAPTFLMERRIMTYDL